ncbi:hypothetical protein F511_19912 [Dorcoceras hygrometricum]|uniref:Uncharacterized protein n=1 Tax=Dorcoceras hygrometricum TaxID=472368 RepID=A0A2Z7CDX5_9LAMI|nr:hypothetical protein F511_19912 [Dorcoceras hygrometricum]
MPPRRREQSDKNKETDSMPTMPELEEFQAADENQPEVYVQGMVECIEGTLMAMLWNDVDNIWRVAQHTKFPKSLPRIQKRRMIRERVATRREVAGNIVSKSKFCRKAIEDRGSEDGDDLLSEYDIRDNKMIYFV